MQPYLDLGNDVLENGQLQTNRTGISAVFLPGAILKFDLAKGFPIITTRKAPWRSAIAEMIGFLRGYTNAADFRSLGCKFWDGNANNESANGPSPWLSSPYRKGQDDLGEIYGYFWRHWVGDDGTVHDQVFNALNTLELDPTNRRMVVTGWKPEAIEQKRGALPPCHIAWHLIANATTRELSLCMWQRSCDFVLGIGGGNIVGYAFLLSWIARLTGYTPRWLVMHLDDIHIYENHIDKFREQLTREPRPLPQLVFADHLHEYHRDGFDPYKITEIHPKDVELLGYDPHPKIDFKMAV